MNAAKVVPSEVQSQAAFMFSSFFEKAFVKRVNRR
jgi:hypothetical protein